MSEKSGVVARRAGLVALGTLASRVLGMARESVVAAAFPVAATDAFFIAFTIPNTLRMLLGEGAVANAFVPVFADVENRAGKQASRAFVARFSGMLALLLLGTCVLGVLGAPWLAWAYAGGLADEPERFALVITLTRWLFPFLGLLGMAALATGVLNVIGRYTAGAFAPALLNVAMIAAPFALVPLSLSLGMPPIGSLALGALLGGALQLGAQLWPLARRDMLPRPRVVLADPDVRRALSLMGPLVFGLGVYQLNMLLSRLFASFLPAGSQSYLNYGMRVVEVPQGMFALALASAALPALAKLRSEGKRSELLALFHDSLRLTLLVAVPASLALYAVAEPAAAVLFGRGAFGSAHVLETARSLGVQALGVWAVAAVRAVIPMFAAHQDTRTPVRASFANLLVFLALSALLLHSLNHVAIALANSVAAAVQLGLLLFWLRKHTGPLGLRAVATSAARILAASLVMTASLLLLVRRYDWLHPSSELARAGWFVALCSAGALIFLIAARLLGVSELTELKRALRRRKNRAT
jgi:putative peptidoglycan lipid II flippase